MSAPVLESRRPSLGRLAGFALLLAGVSLGLCVFSAFPWTGSDPGAAVVRIAFKHVAAFEEATALRSQEEIDKLPRHMRPTSQERARTGRRVETHLTVAVDGRAVLDRHYRPGGLRHDGPTFGYEELAVPPGRRLVEVTLADRQTEGAPAGSGRRWRLEDEVDIAPGQALLVEFSEDTGLSVR
jgi:hypothetical protein